MEGLNVGRWGGGENTSDGGQEEEPSRDTIAEPWARDYRIRYYLSSEKLRPWIEWFADEPVWQIDRRKQK